MGLQYTYVVSRYFCLAGCIVRSRFLLCLRARCANPAVVVPQGQVPGLKYYGRGLGLKRYNLDSIWDLKFEAFCFVSLDP